MDRISGTSATTTSTWARAPATSSSTPACRPAAGSPSSTRTRTSSATSPGACGLRPRGRRGRRPQAAAVPRPVRLAALNLVIHCLPGPLERKARAVANVAAVLAPTGVLFGASVLGDRRPQPGRAGLPDGVQPPGRVRQPRRHRGRPARDPRRPRSSTSSSRRSARRPSSWRGARGSVPRLRDGTAVRDGTIPPCRPRPGISPYASIAAPRRSTSTPRIPRTSRPGRRGSALDRARGRRMVRRDRRRPGPLASRRRTRSASSTTR